MSEPETRRVTHLLAVAKTICDPEVSATWKADALERLGFAIQPKQLRAEAKHMFVQQAVEAGIVDAVVALTNEGRPALILAACNFLGDFVFNSASARRSVFSVFDHVLSALQRALKAGGADRTRLLYTAASFCANIVASCPEGQERLTPLLQTVFVPIVQDPASPDRLVGHTVLLLANLSLNPCGRQVLRAARVEGILLDLVLKTEVPTARKSVAESVVIFLLGGTECAEIDRLMASGVVGRYILPIMESTLAGSEFRGMYPHLVYSARLFEVLARSRSYAETLVAHDEAVPLLLRATHRKDGFVSLETDDEGRCLALEALLSLARFKFWPRHRGHDRCRGKERQGELPEWDSCLDLDLQTPVSRDEWSARDVRFVGQELPQLLADDHAGVRAAAAALWARLHSFHVHTLMLVGNRLEAEGKLNSNIWAHGVVAALFPIKEPGLVRT